MNIRYLWYFMACMAVSTSLRGQTAEQQQNHVREALIESVLNGGGETADFEDVLAEWEGLKRTPLFINTASEQELRKIPFLTAFQIQSLLAYRKQQGNILSGNELRLVYGFSDEAVNLMLSCVRFDPAFDTLVLFSQGAMPRTTHEMVFRFQRLLERSSGYKEDDPATGTRYYPGNPWLYYARYRLEIQNKLSLGFTLEKDPGEEVFRNSNRAGFDYYSAYVMVNRLGPFTSCILGDYRLSFGQGLTLCHGTAPGKSSLVLNIGKRGDRLRPYTSADENDFFRGIAFSLDSKRLSFTGFFSRLHRDACLTDTGTTTIAGFTSFQESGYHRTRAELKSENTVCENAIGGHLNIKGDIFRVGTTLAYYKLDKAMLAGEEPKDVRNFSGSHLVNWGIDHSITLRRIHLFGETAYGNNAWATFHGVQFQANKYLSMLLSYRKYGSGYFSLHSDAFSEGSVNRNEGGFYAGIVLNPAKKWKVSGYGDWYYFPWLKYRISAPSSGSDYVIQTDYALNKRVGMYIRVKHELSPKDTDNDLEPVPQVVQQTYTGLRYHISYQIGGNLEMQNRLEAVRCRADSASPSLGFMVYHDVNYHLRILPMDFAFRLAWFQTDDYNARIYAYEQDLISGFTFPPLYNSGFRSYLMIKIPVTRNADFRLRISGTHLLHCHTIGSGHDIISGPSRWEIKFQLILRLSSIDRGDKEYHEN